MAEFICKVADAQGHVFTQAETAASEVELRQRLNEKGYFIYSIRSRALLALPWTVVAARRRRWSTDDLLLFNQQFVTLVRAGLPILQALDLLAKRTARPRQRAVLDDVRERLRGGESLSEAFRAQSLFSEVYNSTLLAGERSGNLAGVLDQYIAYLKVSRGLQRRLLTAIVYPALLVFFALGVLSYVTLYVIPRFALLYEEMNAELPALTVAVITFALNLRASLLAVSLVVVAAIVGVLVLRRTGRGAQVLDRARLQLPLLGDILLKFRLAQFCRTLGTLLAGGIPLVPSLEVSAGAMESAVLRQAVAGSAERVREGESLHAALADTGAIPTMMTEMIEVGESTGALASMLSSVAEFYEEELNARLTRLLALVEPLLLIVVGGAILIILVALYLPIFSLGSVAR